MPTYLYETIPLNGGATERFEWRQSMNEPALDKHPHTGAAVRRVISGGLGYMRSGERSMPEPGPGPGVVSGPAAAGASEPPGAGLSQARLTRVLNTTV